MLLISTLDNKMHDMKVNYDHLIIKTFSQDQTQQLKVKFHIGVCLKAFSSFKEH